MAANPAGAVRLAQAAEQAFRHEPATLQQQLNVATAQWLAGEGMMRLNEVTAATPLVLAALKSAEQLAPGTKLAGDLLSSRAGLHASVGHFDKALQDYQRAFAIFRKIGDLRAQAVTLQNIGSIYQDAADYERVLYYYGLSTETFANDVILQLSSSNNRANALDQLGRHLEAEKEYEHALTIASDLGNTSAQARILDNLAQSQIDQGKLAAATRSIEKGLGLVVDSDASAWFPLLLGTSARLALDKGETDEAISLIERAFRVSEGQADSAPYRDIHKTAYEAYKRRGDISRSLVHFEVFKRLDDQGRSLAASTSATLAAARFDFINQNSRIAALKTGQLQRDIALANMKSQQLRIVIGALLGIASIIALMLGLYFRSLRRSNRAIADTNMELGRSNAALEDALLAKSQFLATTSHEIRTPLNGVLGMTQVLLADPIITGDIRERVHLIHQAGESMRSLVDDILDAAKGDADSFELDRKPFKLPELLLGIISFWSDEAEASQLKLSLDLSKCPETVVEDEARLRQIVNNLIANAIKFTSNGAISVAAVTKSAGDTEFLEISCTDTGIGIPEERLEDVFEKFVQVDGGITRRFGGSGLGLAICRKLSRAMGGDVLVKSETGVGSTFTLLLPLRRCPPTLPVANESEAKTTPTLQNAEVLVIQPNPMTRGIMTAMLSDYVGALCFVDSTNDALRSVGTGTPDLVVVDGSAAAAKGLVAMTAIQSFLHELSAHQLRAVLLWPQDEGGGSELGARICADSLCKLVIKPASADDLLAAMRSALEGTAAIDKTFATTTSS